MLGNSVLLRMLCKLNRKYWPIKWSRIFCWVKHPVQNQEYRENSNRSSRRVVPSLLLLETRIKRGKKGRNFPFLLSLSSLLKVCLCWNKSILFWDFLRDDLNVSRLGFDHSDHTVSSTDLFPTVHWTGAAPSDFCSPVGNATCVVHLSQPSHSLNFSTHTSFSLRDFLLSHLTRAPLISAQPTIPRCLHYCAIRPLGLEELRSNRPWRHK